MPRREREGGDAVAVDAEFPRMGWRRMTGWLVAGVAAYGVLLAALYLFQRHLLYHPSGATPDPAQAGVPDMQPVRIATDDGLDLLAWYKPAAPGRMLVILFHGNAGDIGHRGWKARLLLDAGHGALLLSWRGYGGNAGRPSQDGLMRDARAALAFAVGQGVPRARIALYGESLGSGVAVILAAEAAQAGSPLGAVLLEAPYTSIAEVAQHHYFYVPARYLVADQFDAASCVARIGAPLLVVHGARDRIVPARFGRALYEHAVEPKEAVWLAQAGHNDLFEHGAGRAVLEFLARRGPAG